MTLRFYIGLQRPMRDEKSASCFLGLLVRYEFVIMQKKSKRQRQCLGTGFCLWQLAVLPEYGQSRWNLSGGHLPVPTGSLLRATQRKN